MGDEEIEDLAKIICRIDDDEAEDSWMYAAEWRRESDRAAARAVWAYIDEKKIQPLIQKNNELREWCRRLDGAPMRKNGKSLTQAKAFALENGLPWPEDDA